MKAQPQPSNTSRSRPTCKISYPATSFHITHPEEELQLQQGFLGVVGDRVIRKNVSKAWARKQIRPYPAPSGGTWIGEVFVGQCFYGFQALELENAGRAASFGGFLPDDAIVAVEDWLQLHHPQAQVTLVCNMYLDKSRLTVLSPLDVFCRMHLLRPPLQGKLHPQAKLPNQGRRQEKSRRTAGCAMRVSNCSGNNLKLNLDSRHYVVLCPS